MSQRLLLYLGICHSPRIVILLVSGLREWDLVRVGLSPAVVHRRTRSAAQGRVGSAVHAPPYIRVGRENGSADVLLVV